MIKSFTGDYTTKFHDYVDYLFAHKLTDSDGEYLSHEARMELADQLIESYVSQTGERPPYTALSRLSVFILKEDTKRRKGRKVAPALEYPHLSDRQYESRVRNEAPLWAYEEAIDSGGLNHAMTTRSTRIQDELRSRQVKD